MARAMDATLVPDVYVSWHKRVYAVDEGSIVITSIISHKTVNLLYKVVIADNVKYMVSLSEACMVLE